MGIIGPSTVTGDGLSSCAVFPFLGLSRDEPEPAHGLGRHSRNSSANEGGASRFWATGIRSAHERAPGGRKPLACLAALEPGLTTYLPWVLCRFALILFVVKILIRKWGAGYFLLGCLRSSSIDLTMDRVADAHRRRGVVHPGCCSIFVSSWRRGFRGRYTDQPERRLKGLNTRAQALHQSSFRNLRCGSITAARCLS